MIRFLTAQQLNEFPALRDGMFRDRADQFVTRLGWDVSVDENGFERDEYDAMNPLYVICEDLLGQHAGSMRFLPTYGNNMIADHFNELLGDRQIKDSGIWECTRFCLAPNAGPLVAGRLMSAGGEMLRGFGLQGFAGVFDARMVRIYQRIGSEPEILGATGDGSDRISVGIWRFTDAARARVARRAGWAESTVSYWFKRQFGDVPKNPFQPLAE